MMWWRFRLARDLRRPLEEFYAMSRSELAHWIAFVNDNPSGPELDDKMNALLCGTMVATRFGSTDTKIDPRPFYLNPHNKKASVRRETNPAELEAYKATLAAAHRLKGS